MTSVMLAKITSLALSTSLVFTVLACGGGAGSADGAKTPAAAEPAAAEPASTAATAPQDTGPTTTTTATLPPNNGELQGAKLGSSSSTTIEGKTTSGPKPTGEGEPGRRVDDIKTIVGGRRDEARKCYDDALKKTSGLEGDLVIKWVIDPKGTVTEIAVDDSKSTIHDAELGKCVIAVIQKIKFAESPKGFESRMNYPFNFHPKGQQANQQPKK
jgi:hypothetical protein